MDVVETGDGAAMPVDFKKGKRPHVAAGAYEPERVQGCVQAMILEDNSHRVEQGDSGVVRPGLIEALKPRVIALPKGGCGNADTPVRLWRGTLNWRTIAATKGDTRL